MVYRSRLHSVANELYRSLWIQSMLITCGSQRSFHGNHTGAVRTMACGGGAAAVRGRVVFRVCVGTHHEGEEGLCASRRTLHRHSTRAGVLDTAVRLHPGQPAPEVGRMRAETVVLAAGGLEFDEQQAGGGGRGGQEPRQSHALMAGHFPRRPATCAPYSANV